MSKNNALLPSKFQIGEKVSVNFQKLGFYVHEAIVIKIHFTHNKVSYDLDVQFDNGDNNIGTCTRIYNVDSLIVSPFCTGKKSMI